MPFLPTYGASFPTGRRHKRSRQRPYMSEADGLTVNSVVANGGNVAISNSTGDMVIHAISAAGGIDLLAAGGPNAILESIRCAAVAGYAAHYQEA